MDQKSDSSEFLDRFTSSRGIILAAFSAFAAEFILGGFLPGVNYLSGVGRVAVVFLTLFVLHRFAFSSLPGYKPGFRDLGCLVLVILGSICILWVGRVLGLGLETYAQKTQYANSVSTDSLQFAVPYATGALLLQAILGIHYALVFAVSFSIIVAFYSFGATILWPYVFVTALVGCLSLSRFRSRSAYIKAGFNVSIVGFAFALGSILIDPSIPTSQIGLRLVGAVLGGGLCALLASGITPIFEYLGGYVTDMRLIEMATLDHPLLKELSVQAPGTWNHSMVMGMMVESAADSIGANPVAARVGAYFHDIGKIKKPLYFVENQIYGENRHDKLSPSMSALIIRAHVKDGIELAKKHKLPKVIEDMIPEHHGNSLIEYFYDKACKEAKEADANAPEVDQSLYTYPGPKPQTREAGILMLADGIEAATRTLPEPTLDRIQGLVQKMINKVFASGELDECELTLKDLHLIAKCFTRVLNGIYHQRIAYAEPAEKTTEKTSSKSATEDNAEAREESAESQEVAGGAAGKKPKVPGEERGTKEDSKEDLKRLGM